MNTEHSQVLEFPAWLYGTKAAILREVRAEGHWWAREYLETGAFPQPRQMRQVSPGDRGLHGLGGRRPEGGAPAHE